MRAAQIAAARSASSSTRRNVALLSACHGLGISAAVVSVTISALASVEIGLSGSWTTVPYGVQFLAVLMTTMPASLLMQRFGRGPVFLVATACGAIGGLVGAAAVGLQSFPLLCLAHALLGITLANVNFFRFAALDVAAEAQRASAMSLVLFGGTFAAILGPTIARRAGDVIPAPIYAAAYVGIALLCVAILMLLAFARFPPAVRPPKGFVAASLRPSLSEPRVIAGLVAGAVGYGFMNLLMVGCSLAMSGHGMAFSTISFAIQLHVLAMYLPSLVMGRLIARFGAMRIAAAGSGLVAAAALAAVELPHASGFVVSLVLLGVGWNAMYVGGSAIVAGEAADAVKFRLQGVNDFCVGIAAMVGAFLPGLLLAEIGWHGLNMLVLAASLAMTLIIAMVAARPATGGLPRRTMR